MSRDDFIQLLYIVAFCLFIIGLRMLRGPRTAVRGNQVAAVGHGHRGPGDAAHRAVGDWILIVVGVAIGTAVGVPAARSVKMTAMPQMVALFNGVGGGAVALISLVEFRSSGDRRRRPLIPSLFAAIIGSISFWGSNIAFLKLQEMMKRGHPDAEGGQRRAAGDRRRRCAVVIAAGTHSELLFWLILVSAGALGVLAVVPIGGADMPVVICTLNAFTGLSAAAAGIALNNTALIVAGMLVGASGSILTKQMADAMNRSIANVFFAGVGTGGTARWPRRGRRHGALHERRRRRDPALLRAPGRRRAGLRHGGRAGAARGRRPRRPSSRSAASRCSSRIHPVAGRMPGHMNVLLAEADVPYEKLKEMDDINGEFARTDVALVIGANDVTNPAARTVAGLADLRHADPRRRQVRVGRSCSSARCPRGFAGIDNPLFYNPKTAMLFGDAKTSVADIVSEVQAL